MRRFPKIQIDVALMTIPCGDCRKVITPFSPVYLIGMTEKASLIKACCEGCADREIARRIAIVKEDDAMKAARA